MAQATQNAAMKAQQQASQNAAFMGLSYEQPFAANAQNGTAYVPGQALNFDAPVVPGGYLTKIVMTVSLTVDVTLGAGTAALNAGGIWNTLSQVNVKFGETQISVHPYAEYVFSLMRGFNRPDTTKVVGNQVADIQALLYSAPTLVNGNNTWTFDIEIPLNSVHPSSVNGLLPIGQTGTKVQIQAIPPSSFTGADPLNNVVSLGGGATATVTGNVNVTCVVRDYHSFSTLAQVQPDLSGLATVQTIKPQEINPLTAGSYQFRSITNPYPLVRYVAFVVDGQSSSTLCAASNIQGYELDQAENTNSAFFRYDSTTGGIGRYYQDVRRRFGQDMPEGVLVFDAPTMNVANPSSLGGNNFLDLTSAGYPAARFGVKVGAVSSANGITPRVVMYATILNPAGIALA